MMQVCKQEDDTVEVKNPFNPDTRFQMHCSWKDGSDDAAIKERGRK